METTAANLDVNLGQTSEMGNALLAELNKLREADPIHWSEASGCWIVTRHADIVDAMRDKYPLSLNRLPQIAFMGLSEEQAKAQYPNLANYLPNWIINLDPPEHTRLRKLLLKTFNRRFLESMRPFIRNRVHELMEKIRNNPEIEFNEEIARLLPGSVIIDLLGLPQDTVSRLRDWSNAFVQGIGMPSATPEMIKAADMAMGEMNALLLPELAARESEPRDDLLTLLVQAREEGDKLTTDEMLGAIHVLLVAGHDSTANTMTLTVAALSENQPALDYMRANPDKIAACNLELMRYIAMSAAQPRVVAEDFEWHGKQLKRGDFLFLMMAGGNRDPRVFDDPEQIDLGRDTDRSLVFGPGVHFCLGHHLAKIQLEEFFTAFVDAVESVEVLDDRLAFMHQVHFRGLYHLNVRFILRS